MKSKSLACGGHSSINRLLVSAPFDWICSHFNAAIPPWLHHNRPEFASSIISPCQAGLRLPTWPWSMYPLTMPLNICDSDSNVKTSTKKTLCFTSGHMEWKSRLTLQVTFWAFLQCGKPYCTWSIGSKPFSIAFGQYHMIYSKNDILENLHRCIIGFIIWLCPVSQYRASTKQAILLPMWRAGPVWCLPCALIDYAGLDARAAHSWLSQCKFLLQWGWAPQAQLGSSLPLKRTIPLLVKNESSG